MKEKDVEAAVEYKSVWSKPLLGLTGLTPRILVVTVILWFANVYMWILYETKYVSTSAYQIPAGIYLLFILLGGYAIAGKKEGILTMPEYAVLVSMGAVTIACSGFIGNAWATNFSLSPASFLVYYYTAYPEYWDLVPASWIPKDSAVIDTWLHGGAIDWGVWAGPYFLWGIYYLAAIISVYFFTLMFRKPLIDIERAPFPICQGGVIEMVKHAKGVEQRRSVFSPRNIPEFPMFWFGVFMGMFVIGSYTFSAWMPWVIPGWPEFNVPFLSSTGGGGHLYLDVYLADVAPGPAWNLHFNWTRSWPITAFAPMNILYTALLVAFVFKYLIPLVGVSSGALDWAYRWEWDPTYYYEQQGQWGFFFQHEGVGGFLYGLGIAYILLNWKQIARTLKMAMSGEPREDGEPWSWRTVWIVWPVMAIVVIGLAAMMGVPAILAVGLYVMLLLVSLFTTLIWSKFGAAAATTEFRWTYASVPLNDFGKAIGAWGSPPGNAAFTTVAFSNLTLNYVPWHYSWQSAGGLGIHALSKELGADERAVSLAFIASTVILMLIIGPLSFMFIHMVGGHDMIASYGLAYTGGWGTHFTAPTVNDLLTLPTEDLFMGINPHPAAFAGIIGAIIVMYLHANFAWFILDPIGIYIGATSTYTDWVGSMLIMVIIRYLIMKVGGARIYSRYWIPFAIGAIAGIVIPNFFVPIAIQTLGWA